MNRRSEEVRGNRKEALWGRGERRLHSGEESSDPLSKISDIIVHNHEVCSMNVGHFLWPGRPQTVSRVSGTQRACVSVPAALSAPQRSGLYALGVAIFIQLCEACRLRRDKK